MWYKSAEIAARENRTAFEKMAGAGMGRLLKHMVAGNFAIISPEKSDQTPEEKNLALRRLKKRVRELGYGFVETKGAWKEESGIYGQERSIFVPLLPTGLAEALGREFGQEAIIAGDHGQCNLVSTTGEQGENIAKFDLAESLRIPPLDESPEMYTGIGYKKFVLDNDLNLSPEQVEERRKKLEAVTDRSKLGAVRKEALHCFIRAGNPPPMRPKFSMQILHQNPEYNWSDALIVSVPFTVTIRENLPRFVLSKHWGEPIMVRQAGTKAEFVPAAPEIYEQELAKHSKFRGGVDDLVKQQASGRPLAGLESLYLGPTGQFYLLTRPHSHDETSRAVLRSIHPELPAIRDKYRKGGGYTHADLSRATGILRMQWNERGIGVTINMDNPPSEAQLEAIRQAYMRTPMESFIAEISSGDVVLTHLTSFKELLKFVRYWDPDNPTAGMSPAAGLIYERTMADD